MTTSNGATSDPSSTKKHIRELPQHGVKGVFYAGEWLDIEDCAGKFIDLPEDSCSSCPAPCPRSQSRNTATKPDGTYDVLIIGAGCIGAAIARELSRYKLAILWLEAADDVSQGATKGNSGIVHAGYDDTPDTNRAKYCWKGNQMFKNLDKELRFGYQTNGSLVLACDDKELQVLETLKKRGEINGVERLRIVDKKELFEMEPYLHPDVVAALYAPDAGNVIPYEFAIALAENAVDNGVELRIRREVTNIAHDGQLFEVTVNHWEPSSFVKATNPFLPHHVLWMAIMVASALITTGMGIRLIVDHSVDISTKQTAAFATYTVLAVSTLLLFRHLSHMNSFKIPRTTPMDKLVSQAGVPEGNGGVKVQTEDMLVGGSGSSSIVKGESVGTEIFQSKYVINCAGGASDKISRMIGDDSFTIKPRIGDYLLLNRNQGYLAKHTLFPCPDPLLGKGVLVQTTLWGNLILGPTSRDMYNAEARNMSDAAIQEYILSKCKRLVPSFDPKETFHAFCGARAKNSRGDWIIEPSVKNGKLIHVAGIDSPGLAGSPAIALEVVRLLQEAGCGTPKNDLFNPNRAPIITPKNGMKGLKMGPVGKNDSDGRDEKMMACNVVCKCEKVTELEVVRAMRRSLPIDSSQGIRKRTRAGMGHCQGDPENYCCEGRVRAIIARENGVPMNQVGGRPWPATSTLTQRWIDDNEKDDLKTRMGK